MGLSSKQYGVTAMELLITLAIVAVVGASVTPSIMSHVRKERLKGAAESLYQSLVKARSEAISRRQDVNVIFVTGSNWCLGVTTNSTCSCTTAGSCTLGQNSYSNYSNVTMATASITNNKVTFEFTRGLLNSTGTITFSNSYGDSVSIVLYRLGPPKVCATNISGYESCS